MKFKNVKKTLYLRGAGTVLTLSLAAGTIAPAAPAFAEAQDSTVSEKEVSETDAARDDVSLGTEAETTAAAEAAEHTEAAASEANSPVSQTLESEKAESGTGETVAAETASNTDGTGETLPITDDEELLAEIIAEEISVDQLTLYQKGTYRLATVVNTDWLNIRADAGSEYKVVDAIRAGVTVTVYGEKKASDGTTWYLISDGSIMGYSSGSYLNVIEKAYDTEEAFEQTLAAFPESYRESLRALHAQYPNWKFEAYQTGIDWQTAVDEESKFGSELSGMGTEARSLVYKGSISSWKSMEEGAFDWSTGQWVTNWDGDYWAIASRELVAYYMDPRNFMDNNGIFQFLDLTYDSTQTAAYVSQAAASMGSSWLSGTHQHANGDVINYPEVIAEAGKSAGINPIFLAATLTQELGTNGSEKTTISGTASWTVSRNIFDSIYASYCPAYTVNADGTVTVNYTGVYNYYNVGAYTDTGFSHAYERGLWIGYHKTLNGRAYDGPWTTRQAAITGGAKYLARYLTDYDQTNVYLKRFNMTENGRYNHQYSTDVQGAASEGRLIGRAYTESMRKEIGMTFRIPVYNNMPSSAATMPTGDEDPVNTQQIRAFVTRLYEKILGRKPDTKGLDAWSKLLQTRENTAAEVAAGFVFSDEYQNKNKSDKDYVTMLYNTMLDRSPDKSGLNSWCGLLDDGVTRQYIFAGFIGSNEFGKLCDSYGITAGTWNLTAVEDQNARVTAFVTRMYTVCLQRGADASGRRDWIRLLLNGSNSAADVVRGFFNSQEFLKKNLSDEDFVERLYLTLFDRNSDPAGKADWLRNLKNGSSRNQILNGFIGSQEFIRLCEQYGIRQQ